MTDTNQKQLGNTLWSIADQLRGAMDADEFRDDMLSFLFLRYRSDNHESAGEFYTPQQISDILSAIVTPTSSPVKQSAAR